MRNLDVFEHSIKRHPLIAGAALHCRQQPLTAWSKNLSIGQPPVLVGTAEPAPSSSPPTSDAQILNIGTAAGAAADTR